MTFADRPDIRKSKIDFKISFRNAKKLLYKFLFLCNLKFDPDVCLNLEVEYPVKDGSELLYNLYLENLNFYNVTAKLKSFSVNEKPVYIVMIPKNLGLLGNRHRAKLMVLQKQYNIVIFDNSDLKKVGVQVSKDDWIKPLDKITLKKWITLLYKKIQDLGGVVHSRTSYGKIIKYVENPDSAHFNPLVKKLTNELLILKYKLILTKLPKGSINNPEKVIKEFAQVPNSTRLWWFKILKSIQKCNTRDESIKKLSKNYTIQNLGNCFFKVINTKTFDYLVLSLHEVRTVSLPHKVNNVPSNITGLAINIFLNENYFSYKLTRFSRKKVLGYIETQDLNFLNRNY